MEKDKYSQDREGNLLKCTLKRTRGQILNEDRRSTPAEYAGTIRVPVRRPDHLYFRVLSKASTISKGTP